LKAIQLVDRIALKLRTIADGDGYDLIDAAVEKGVW
jgi:hypothetical protein